MNLFKISDKIVFNTLKNIKFGYLEITNHSGELLKFGNPRDSLKANIEIKKSNFTFNLIKGGSVGLAESYMKNEFETKNLSCFFLDLDIFLSSYQVVIGKLYLGQDIHHLPLQCQL